MSALQEGQGALFPASFSAAWIVLRHVGQIKEMLIMLLDFA
jgi:hypothetical protein